MNRVCFVVCIAVISGCSAGTAKVEGPVAPIVEPVQEEDENVDSVIRQGREATRMFYAGEVAPLHARFSAAMVAALPADQWAATRAKLLQDLGSEVEVLGESTSQLLDNNIYRRRVTFTRAPGVELFMTWAFLADGTITGFTISPPAKAADTPHLEYRTKTALRVPFDDEWTVVWGGRTVEENYHAATLSQRFALDLLVTGPDRRSYTGDATKNESYLAFGKPVVAPGKGKIVAVVADVADNVPGQMNPAQAAGNYVLIDHDNGEYSLLAHFKQGSVTVQVGDEVEAGQLLGSCGNSGNSSEPHIHYHLQNSPVPLEGESLPIFFGAATIGGQLHRDVEIVQGQRVSPGSP